MGETKKRDSNLCCYDFTLPYEIEERELVNKLLTFCKKGFFQHELSKTGYHHWQGRISLLDKIRPSRLIKMKLIEKIHWSPTSNKNKNNYDYVTKDYTRIGYPVDINKKLKFIPEQYKGLHKRLKPFQQTIWDSADIKEFRKTNLVYDPPGKKGKSTVAALIDLHDRGIDLPPFNDSIQLIQATLNILEGKKLRTPRCICIDLPRSMNQNKLGELYTAIEQIKKGKVYDFRYKYREWWFDSPQIWVFCNVLPLKEYLSVDRWSVFTIDEKSMELVKTSFEEIEELGDDSEED